MIQLGTRCLHNNTNFSCCMLFLCSQQILIHPCFTYSTIAPRVDITFKCAFNDFLFFCMVKSMVPIYHVSWLSSRSAILKRSSSDSASSFLNVHQPSMNIKHHIQINSAIIDELLSETFPGKLYRR